MPLGDDRLFVNFAVPSLRGGVDFQISICAPDASVCGRRVVDPDIYDSDICYSEYEGSDLEMVFTPSHYSNDHIEAGAFMQNGEFTPEGYHRLRCNDLPYVTGYAPPNVKITAPAPDAALSRSSGDKIRLEWSPSASGLPMKWELFPVDNELELLPCDMLSWEHFEDQGEDLGFAEIPMDIIPSDLPPEGCELILTVSRRKVIEPPLGLENSIIRSTAIDGIVLRVVP